MTLLHVSSSTAVARHRSTTLTPADDDRRQCEQMSEISIFTSVNDEIGEIIMADVNTRIREVTASSGAPSSSG